MDFLQKLDFMMEKYGLNKRALSIKSDIPYTTIDNWYKRGYEGLKLATLRKLSDYFNTLLDFWVIEDITDPNYGKANGFQVRFEEAEHIKKYRLLDPYGKQAVDSILSIEHKRCTGSAESKTTHLYIAARDGSRIETDVEGEIIIPEEDPAIPG